ncbi:MAG: hypothetical protein R3C39_14115 [Dehalococcoidia bacterium]
MPTDDEKQAYREAYANWQQHLERLHAFLLEGERPGGPTAGPDAIKGLFNREARAKERYDEARRRLIGIDE